MYVRDIKKSGPILPDIYECRLHPRQDPDDPASIDIPDQFLAGFSLYEEFNNDPVFYEGNPSFVRSGIDDEFISHDDPIPNFRNFNPKFPLSSIFLYAKDHHPGFGRFP